MLAIPSFLGIAYAEGIPSVKDSNPMSGSPKYSRAELNRQRQAQLEADRQRQAAKEAQQRQAAEKQERQRQLGSDSDVLKKA